MCYPELLSPPNILFSSSPAHVSLRNTYKALLRPRDVPTLFRCILSGMPADTPAPSEITIYYRLPYGRQKSIVRRPTRRGRIFHYTTPSALLPLHQIWLQVQWALGSITMAKNKEYHLSVNDDGAMPLTIHDRFTDAPVSQRLRYYHLQTFIPSVGLVVWHIQRKKGTLSAPPPSPSRHSYTETLSG